MDERSVKTLQRIQENDPTLTELNIGKDGGVFERDKDGDFSLLGVAIEKNTYLRKLSIGTDGLDFKLDDNSLFFIGLKRNSSIRELYLLSYGHIDRLGNEVLNVYQANNNLTTLHINAQISNRGRQVIVNTLKKCTKLKVIDLSYCRINDEYLLQIVGALRGNHVIEELNLSNLSPPRIGNDTCHELATLLEDPDCNLHTLNIESAYISKEGLIAIANGLTNNTKLKRLFVERYYIDSTDAFSKLSCDISNTTAPTVGLQSVPSTAADLSIDTEKKVVKVDNSNDNDYIIQKQNDAWQHVSMFILGEVLTEHIAKAGKRIVELLNILLKTVKKGCCSDVPVGHMCGRCDSSKDVIRISRAIILSICKLPLEFHDAISTKRELEQMRSWMWNQTADFYRSQDKEIHTILPLKMFKLINSMTMIHPSEYLQIEHQWDVQDFGRFLRPPTSNRVRINLLMLMGYKVVLIDFNDVCSFAKKEMKFVYYEASRLLCPPESKDDTVNTSTINDNNDSTNDISGKAGQVDDNKEEAVSVESPTLSKSQKKREKKKLKKRAKQALLKQQEEALFKQLALSNQALFEQPPPEHGDCPICFLRIPTLESGYRYQTCCGKIICSGCIHIHSQDDSVCPFCSTPFPASDEEITKRLEKRVEAGDAEAMQALGCCYDYGDTGLPQDHAKALELWYKAGELGLSESYYLIGCSYDDGDGIGMDKKKAKQYFELAAMKGSISARPILGNMEKKAGNMDKALKHYMIAVKGGYKSYDSENDPLQAVGWLYLDGHASKDDYDKALEADQAYLDEIKSDQRDKAAAYGGDYRYKYY